LTLQFSIVRRSNFRHAGAVTSHVTVHARLQRQARRSARSFQRVRSRRNGHAVGGRASSRDDKHRRKGTSPPRPRRIYLLKYASIHGKILMTIGCTDVVISLFYFFNNNNNFLSVCQTSFPINLSKFHIYHPDK